MSVGRCPGAGGVLGTGGVGGTGGVEGDGWGEGMRGGSPKDSNCERGADALSCFCRGGCGLRLGLGLEARCFHRCVMRVCELPSRRRVCVCVQGEA